MKKYKCVLCFKKKVNGIVHLELFFFGGPGSAPLWDTCITLYQQLQLTKYPKICKDCHIIFHPDYNTDIPGKTLLEKTIFKWKK
jgi:hypothetical protein